MQNNALLFNSYISSLKFWDGGRTILKSLSVSRGFSLQHHFFKEMRSYNKSVTLWSPEDGKYDPGLRQDGHSLRCSKGWKLLFSLVLFVGTGWLILIFTELILFPNQFLCSLCPNTSIRAGRGPISKEMHQQKLFIVFIQLCLRGSIALNLKVQGQTPKFCIFSSSELCLLCCSWYWSSQEQLLLWPEPFITSSHLTFTSPALLWSFSLKCSTSST